MRNLLAKHDLRLWKPRSGQDWQYQPYTTVDVRTGAVVDKGWELADIREKYATTDAVTASA